MTKKVYAMKTLSKFEMVTFVCSFVTVGVKKYVLISDVPFVQKLFLLLCTTGLVIGPVESRQLPEA